MGTLAGFGASTYNAGESQDYDPRRPGGAMSSTRQPGGAAAQQALTQAEINQRMQIAQLNAATANHAVDAPLDWKKSVWGQTWPYAQKMLADPFGQIKSLMGSGGIGGGIGGGGGGLGGVGAPNISTQDLINPMQTRMLMNNANAGVVARNQTAAKDAREHNAASGFGSNSPAFAEMQNARDMGANIEQSNNALNFPLQTQKANADYRRSGEALQTQGYSALLRAMGDMYGSQLNYAGGLQSALLRSVLG